MRKTSSLLSSSDQTFAHVYKNLLQNIIIKHPAPHTSPHDLPHVYEILNHTLTWDASRLSIYSDKSSITFPILFALSLQCWTLSGYTRPHLLLKPLTSEALEIIGPNHHFLFIHIQRHIKELIGSTNTYQSSFKVFQMSDIIHLLPGFPRKVEMHFLIRDNHLNLIVSSESSDIISSLPIDAFQWQVIFKLFLNELNEISLKKILPGHIHYNIGSLYMTQQDHPHYQKFHFPAHTNKFDHHINIYQSFSNVQFRSSKRFGDARTLSHLLDILDIGTANKITKIHRIFKRRMHKMDWDDF